MSDIPKARVLVFSYFRQFGKGVCYLSSKKEKQWKILGVSSFGFMLVGYFIFMIRGPIIENEVLDQKSKESQYFDLSLLPENSVDHSQKTKKKRARREKVIYYGGLEKIVRPGLEDIPPGLIGKAVLLSVASVGPVRARLTESLTFNDSDILPEGTLFIGTATQGKHRVQVKFSRILFPSGAVQSINSIALDASDKNVGLKASKSTYYAVKFGATAGLHFLSGVSEGFKTKEVKDGIAVDKPTLGNSALQGATRATEELSKQSLSEMKTNPPHMKAPANTTILILFN